MKNKNPLYVVKGKTVQEAKGMFDLLIKKFNLEPAVKILMNLMGLLLAQVNSYPMLVTVKKMVDELIEKMTQLFNRFQKA